MYEITHSRGVALIGGSLIALLMLMLAFGAGISIAHAQTDGTVPEDMLQIEVTDPTTQQDGATDGTTDGTTDGATDGTDTMPDGSTGTGTMDGEASGTATMTPGLPETGVGTTTTMNLVLFAAVSLMIIAIGVYLYRRETRTAEGGEERNNWE